VLPPTYDEAKYEKAIATILLVNFQEAAQVSSEATTETDTTDASYNIGG
jgi:hypothetical protein